MNARRSLPFVVLPLGLLLSISACGSNHPAGSPAAPMGSETAAGTMAKNGAAGRKVAFYRNPMDPKVTSPVFKKDSMGMDYLPVYQDELEPAASATPAGTRGLGTGVGVSGLATVRLGEDAIHLAGITTEVAVAGSLARSTRTPGIVVPDEARIHHVHTKISGWVESLEVNFTGQQVKTGQPFLTLYSPELLATQEEYLRAKETAARFSHSALPEVRSGGADLLSAARRRLELFDVPPSFIAHLDETGKPQRAVPVYAHLPPGTVGYVLAKQAFEGQQIDPGMELFTVADLSRIWVEADFYEYEARALRVGQSARVKVAYDPSLSWVGRIAYIYPTLATESRTLKVRIELANPKLALKPGMYVDVAVDLDSRDGTVVPDSSIIDSGLRQIAFVETAPGTFAPRQVQVVQRSDGKALVLSGIQPGERVVTRANFLLDSESRLRAAIAGSAATGKAGAPEGDHP